MNVIWIILACFFFAVLGVLVKLGAGRFSSTELAFYRSFFGLVFLYMLIRWRGHPLQRTNLRGHLGRSVAGVATTLLFFHALATLPLATATTLNYTSPLFLALLSILWLKEKTSFLQMVTLCLGFGGVVLLLGPSLTRGQLPDALLGLASGLTGGIAYMNVRSMGREGVTVWDIVFYFSLISTLLIGFILLFQPLHPISFAGFWIICGTGVAGTFGQLCVSKAYQGGQTVVTGAFNYSTLIFASLFGIIFWQEFLPPLAWAGMAILIASGVIMILLQARYSRRSKLL